MSHDPNDLQVDEAEKADDQPEFQEGDKVSWKVNELDQAGFVLDVHNDIDAFVIVGPSDGIRSLLLIPLKMLKKVPIVQAP